MLVFFAIWGGMAFVVAQMSRDREIGFWTLFAVSLFFTPFIGVIAGLMSRKKRPVGNAPPTPTQTPEPTPEPDIGNDPFWKRFAPKKGE